MNKAEITLPTAEGLLRLVCEAYLIRQTATYRRPVYRHQYGDIPLSVLSLEGFIDGYLIDTGKTVKQRGEFYYSLLNWQEMTTDRKELLCGWVHEPELTKYGIEWIGVQLDQFGDMVQDMGPETAKKLMGVKS